MWRKVKKILSLVGCITLDTWYEAVYFAKFNARYLASIIEILLPYCMYMLGQIVAMERGGVESIEVGGEIFVPILCTVIVHYVRELANKSGNGNTIPIPSKRFTEVSEDGEVSVENNRLQEMLLYVADLEDWMERKRWLQ